VSDVQPAKQKPTQTGERKISPTIIVLGVIACLVLALVCFGIGMIYFGPWLKSHGQSDRQISAQPSYTPPPAPSPTTETVPPPPVKVEITEENSDASSSNQNKDNSLTVTLEPKTDGESTVQPTDTTEKTVNPPKPVVESKPPTASSDKPVYRVQLGTYSNKINADNLAQDINKTGRSVEVTQVQVEDRTLYRVQIGNSFNSRDKAQNLAKTLSSEGYTPAIVIDKKSD
jgi:cell division protein FtsN